MIKHNLKDIIVVDSESEIEKLLKQLEDDLQEQLDGLGLFNLEPKSENIWDQEGEYQECDV